MRSPIAAAVLIALLLAAGDASASSPDPVIAAGDRLAGAWAAQQRPDGTFPDYVKESLGTSGRNTYSEGMLGPALLRWGLLRGRTDWVGAGRKALEWAFDHPTEPGAVDRLFEDFALLDGYAAVSSRFPARADASFVDRWRQRLGQVSVDVADGQPMNQQVLGAIIQLEASQLTAPIPAGPGGVFADRAAAGVAARARLASHVADVAALVDTTPSGTRNAIIGDPPAWPLAYHALSAAWLARVVDVGGERAVPGIRAALRDALAGSALVAAPDGQLAYAGRSNEESWALAMTAYAGRAAGTAAGGWVSGVAARRLLTAHAEPRFGLVMLPAMASDLTTVLSAPVLDSYAAAVPYAGLTLMGLVWAAATRAPASSWKPQTAVVGGAQSASVGVINTPRLWVAARGTTSAPTSARELPGLLGMKTHDAKGWHDVLAGRATVLASGDDPGPVLDDGVAPTSVTVTAAGSVLLGLASKYPLSSTSTALIASRCSLAVTAHPVTGRRVFFNLVVPGATSSMASGRIQWATGTLSPGAGTTVDAQPGPATASHVETTRLRVTGAPGATTAFTLAGRTCG